MRKELLEFIWFWCCCCWWWWLWWCWCWCWWLPLWWLWIAPGLWAAWEFWPNPYELLDWFRLWWLWLLLLKWRFCAAKLELLGPKFDWLLLLLVLFKFAFELLWKLARFPFVFVFVVRNCCSRFPFIWCIFFDSLSRGVSANLTTTGDEQPFWFII